MKLGNFFIDNVLRSNIPMNSQILDGAQEHHYGVTVCLRQVVEFHCRVVCLAVFAVAVPHDGLYLVAGTAVERPRPQSGVVRHHEP